MRISDWSSDVCSSDLNEDHRGRRDPARMPEQSSARHSHRLSDHRQGHVARYAGAEHWRIPAGLQKARKAGEEGEGEKGERTADEHIMPELGDADQPGDQTG